MPDPSSSPASSTSSPEREQPREGKVPSWRVEPAPDGRGAPPPPRPPLMPRNRRGTFIGILVALLAVKFILALVTGSPGQRTRVPSQAFFFDQVKVGSVEEVGSTEHEIDGEL